MPKASHISAASIIPRASLDAPSSAIGFVFGLLTEAWYKYPYPLIYFCVRLLPLLLPCGSVILLNGRTPDIASTTVLVRDISQTFFVISSLPYNNFSSMVCAVTLTSLPILIFFTSSTASKKRIVGVGILWVRLIV